jgi:hypothetical protein
MDFQELTISKNSTIVQSPTIKYCTYIMHFQITHDNHQTKWNVKGKKAIPLQPWTGPEGSGRLRLPDFKTVGT